MNRFAAVALAVLLLADGVSAQNPPPQHQHDTPAVIDGSLHPELIPDSLAYRLYLTAVAIDQSATEDAQKKQHAHLIKTGLRETDMQTLISILADFKSKYDALVNSYNESAKAALTRNETADVQGLLKKLDELVQSTRDSISARLTSKGAAQLHSFVMAEKQNMKVLPED